MMVHAKIRLTHTHASVPLDSLARTVKTNVLTTINAKMVELATRNMTVGDANVVPDFLAKNAEKHMMNALRTMIAEMVELAVLKMAGSNVIVLLDTMARNAKINAAATVNVKMVGFAKEINMR